MKMNVMLAAAALMYAPLAMAGEKGAYPEENVATFVVNKLDMTSLPSAYRPKKEKGKKTLADYGYAAQKVKEKEALVEMAGGARRLSIRILEESGSGIYACVTEPPKDGGNPLTQSVVLLKRKDANGLLKGRETWREFTSCPVIGGSSDDSSAY
jgi:hypothetical protein